MTVYLAIKTMTAIEESIAADQGAGFRVYQGQVMPHMKDAYRGADEGHRSHLGASMVGKECGRAIWYGFRWALKPKHSGRILRLFNRGHLEEARFIAMLLSIGVQVFQADANGNQYRISDVDGHFGGSGDGVGIGIPDLPPTEPCLLEFKTHGEKSFIKLSEDGVRKAKFEHFVQMTLYMGKMKLAYALYGAVNKNTDEVYMEIIPFDPIVYDQYMERARKVIEIRVAPERIRSASPGLFACRFCDYKNICLLDAKPDQNCRTCYHAQPAENGTWVCNSRERQMTIGLGGLTEDDHTTGETQVLTKERQLTGCKRFYTPV